MIRDKHLNVGLGLDCTFYLRLRLSGDSSRLPPPCRDGFWTLGFSSFIALLFRCGLCVVLWTVCRTFGFTTPGKQVFFSNYGKMDEQKKISGEIKNKNGRVSSIKCKQDGPDSSGKRRFLGASEAKQLKGLQYIVEAFETENYGTSNIDEIIQNDINSQDNMKPKRLSRSVIPSLAIT